MQLVDAGMLAFPAYHALEGKVDRPLTYQLPRMLRARMREAADTFALFWNGDRLRKRELWPDYRDRPEIWNEAGREDFESAVELLSALGAVQFRTEGREADEVLAAVTHRLEGREELLIRSDDKDFMQLLSGSTWMEGSRRGTVRFSDVRDILGVSPAFVADFLALSGDDADGIPRIVSPSVARDLIESRGHVRDWIDRDLRVGPEVREAIRENREQIRLNLRLVDLSEEAVGEPPSPLREGWADPDRARQIGEELGLGYLTDGDPSEEFGVLLDWGRKTRKRLSELGLY